MRLNAFTMHESCDFAIWLRNAYLAFHRRVNAWMLKHGITADQYVVLRSVVVRPGTTQIEIVERVGSDPNTVTAILRFLEQRDLVRRESHAHDGRARCVFPTTAGLNLERRARKDADPLLAALRGCSAEHDQNLRFLQRIPEVFCARPRGVNGQPPTRVSPAMPIGSSQETGFPQGVTVAKLQAPSARKLRGLPPGRQTRKLSPPRH
jgi:DNA-binding MarR family transcriptional regulator